MSERFDKGMATRRAVLGDTHVDRAEANKNAFDAPFQSMITEGAWGTLWSDDTISRRDRSMLTLLYLHFAILGPSATLAEVADGVVRDV